MSNDWILKTLVSLGLSEMDAEIYVYLVKNGSQTAKDIVASLKVHRQQLYRSLKNLQNKGIVVPSKERPARFSAVMLEKVLEIFLKAKIEQQQNLQKNKAEILSTWQSLVGRDLVDT